VRKKKEEGMESSKNEKIPKGKKMKGGKTSVPSTKRKVSDKKMWRTKKMVGRGGGGTGGIFLARVLVGDGQTRGGKRNKSAWKKKDQKTGRTLILLVMTGLMLGANQG